MLTDAHTPTEEASFKKLYDEYKNRLYGYILAIVHSPDAAKDITQELFIKLWVNRNMLVHIIDHEHYIFTMARNKTLNYIRKANNDARVMDQLKNYMAPDHNEVEEQIIYTEYQQLVGKALENLSPQRRLVFRLSRYQGLRLEEIARQMSLSKNTVKNHLVEALRYIRNYLANHGITFLLLTFLLLK
jgi:RNA polymerase sigma-70 factor (ECF subfamily)